MKKRTLIVLISFAALVMSSCGALPTLPPLDSTVTIRTPKVTVDHAIETAASQVIIMTVTGTPAASETGSPTATAGPVFTQTATPAPSSPTPGKTAIPSSTPTAVATKAPTATFTPTAVPYMLQLMNPYYLKNFTREELGCDWLGVAGQIFDAAGQVQKGVVIRAGGDVNGAPVIEDMTMPLAEPAIDLAYGPGGFELTLAASLADTENEVWIQLFSLGGKTLSDKIYLKTYDDCQKNLILINFVER